jgi:replicative DNA helicase
MSIQWKTWAKVVMDQATALEQLAIRRVEGTLKPEDLFVPTGIKRWDANGGLTRGVLTVLGGVDGQGKSFVSNHLGQSAAKCGLQVAQIVFEDPEVQVANRSIANQTGIDSRKLGLVTFDVMDLDKIYAAAGETAKWGANIHYHSGLTSGEEVLEALELLAQKLIAAGKTLDLVLLDYAQALPEGKEGLESVIRHFAWDANKFAQKYNCAFVVFSQVKPEISARGHGVFWAAQKKDPDAWDVSGFMPGPGTQDLAWSSAFGQRARAVGYIYRPGYYERQLGKPGALDDRIWIRWAKVSFGVSALLEMKFEGKTGRIYE